MPTAPTIRSISGTAQGIVVEYGNTGTGDHNELWRSTLEEYGGAFIKVGDDLAWVEDDFTSVIDYNVASGVSYSYQVIGVDAGGGTAASTTAQAAATLVSAVLHAVMPMRGADISNALEIVGVVDLIPHARQYKLGTAQFRHMGMFGDVPILEVSSIEENQAGLLIRIPVKNPAGYSGEAATRAALRAMVLSRRYICLRDTRGNKFFGMMSYSEVYSMPTFSDITMQFYVCDFNEEIA